VVLIWLMLDRRRQCSCVLSLQVTAECLGSPDSMRNELSSAFCGAIHSHANADSVSRARYQKRLGVWSGSVAWGIVPLYLLGEPS